MLTLLQNDSKPNFLRLFNISFILFVLVAFFSAVSSKHIPCTSLSIYIYLCFFCRFFSPLFSFHFHVLLFHPLDEIIGSIRCRYGYKCGHGLCDWFVTLFQSFSVYLFWPPPILFPPHTHTHTHPLWSMFGWLSGGGWLWPIALDDWYYFR